MSRDLEQERARYALKTIEKRGSMLGKDDKKRARYLAKVKSLPATLIMCGLGQTAAMLLSVGKGQEGNPDQMLYRDLESWLCAGFDRAPYREKNLMEAIIKNDRSAYIKAQAEALKMLEWLKKFATASFSEGVKSL